MYEHNIVCLYCYFLENKRKYWYFTYFDSAHDRTGVMDIIRIQTTKLKLTSVFDDASM